MGVEAAVVRAGAHDLSVMHPDVEMEIAGRRVTVREPRFLQGLRIRSKAHALVRDLAASIKGGEGLTDDVLDVLARHDALVRELIVEVTDGADIDWVEALSDIDGETLLLAWWSVCGPFFVRQIARRLADEARVQALIEQASGGPTSPSSSPQSVAANQPCSPSATPNVN